MLRVQKDVATKALEVMAAWEKMRPDKQLYGLTLDAYKLAAKPYLDARAEIADLDARSAHAISKRDAAAGPLLLIVQGVVNAVKGDPTEGQDGELYAAMGYVPKSQRSTGLVRGKRRKGKQSGDESSS